MQTYDQLRLKLAKYRFAVLLIILILVIGIVITVFAFCGADKKEDAQESVAPREVAEQVVDDADQIMGAVMGTEASVEVSTNTSIEEIIEISELQTLRYEYNAICRVYEDDGVTPKYYVAYDGDVVLGIDISELRIDYGTPDNHVITVTIPEVTVLSSTVDAGTMDFIFVDNSYNTANATIEAHPLCEQDLYNKASQDEAMFEIARENTEAEVRGLTAPLVQQFYPEYDLVIEWEE